MKVVNKGDRPLRLGYNSQITVINPGQEGFIERECAVIHFGNPALRNNAHAHHPDDQRARTIEWNRLRGVYGASVGYEGADSLWNENKPKVEVAEVTGEKWVTVVEDPQGESLPVVGMPEPDKELVLEAMQRQIQELQSQVATQKATPMAVPDEDKPTHQRKRKDPVIEPVRDVNPDDE